MRVIFRDNKWMTSEERRLFTRKKSTMDVTGGLPEGFLNGSLYSGFRDVESRVNQTGSIRSGVSFRRVREYIGTQERKACVIERQNQSPDQVIYLQKLFRNARGVT